MENQHKRIIHERDLNENEVNLLNKLRGVGTVVQAELTKLEHNDEIDKRLLSIAKTHLQTGFMFAERSVTKPTGF